MLRYFVIGHMSGCQRSHSCLPALASMPALPVDEDGLRYDYRITPNCDSTFNSGHYFH